ncbi:IS3 family transposase [Arcanobacterium phocae]|uniref:IS3 family transposase n=1 Tax=Arcanobacterium phocae TaxID=131112 RepID=UPI0038B36D54
MILWGLCVDIHVSNYGVYGVGKMWRALGCAWIMIGREQIARLMRLAGLSGKGIGRSSVVSRPRRCEDTRLDLVNRHFCAVKPGQLWVGRYYVWSNTSGVCVCGFCCGCFQP